MCLCWKGGWVEHWVWMGVGCPPIRNDIVTPASLLAFSMPILPSTTFIHSFLAFLLPSFPSTFLLYCLFHSSPPFSLILCLLPLFHPSCRPPFLPSLTTFLPLHCSFLYNLPSFLSTFLSSFLLLKHSFVFFYFLNDFLLPCQMSPFSFL